MLYIRQELDLSQAQLAKIAGTTQQAIHIAESGKARNPRYLPRLAQKIGVPFEWLALNVLPPDPKKAVHLSAREGEFLSEFRTIPRKEQDLLLQLIRSRKK